MSRSSPDTPNTPNTPGRPGSSGGPAAPGRSAADRVSRGLSWLVVLGSLLVLAGLVGLVYVGVATLTSVLLFGWLLLFGGVVALAHALASRHSRYVWLGLIVGALNIAAGLILILHPDVSAAGLTLFAGLLFLSGGVFRLFGGLVVRGSEMIWSLVQGAFGILLGILVLAEWPESTRYVLGTFFSLALLFDGLGLIATGMGGRQLVRMVAPGESGPAGRAGDGGNT
ncbi:HdeD family acid-resistance protein [Streptomyces aidingensis]|uniref:Uncharacterized membrane protein HdeD, DUF308 family n=1 Tax=Streptomyces aidingensis TaxID=910347 RepID=A0A1I1JD06_9ACTN|nr:DUF308 domain-containing protein [Streptomyces aidingensis]SFC46031.1 Uncharacterized membrane protein HdeD, DUF308 family [Streptomyces aidingensis]